MRIAQIAVIVPVLVLGVGSVSYTSSDLPKEARLAKDEKGKEVRIEAPGLAFVNPYGEETRSKVAEQDTGSTKEYMVLSAQAGDKSPLFNRTVKNHKGEPLGTIDRLIFDVREGKIAYVVISLENGRLVPLPWSSFSVSHDDQVIILNATEEQLEKAVITTDVNEILGQ
jgi:sporulation protein YlmC with PRC-barrel domain